MTPTRNGYMVQFYAIAFMMMSHLTFVLIGVAQCLHEGTQDERIGLLKFQKSDVMQLGLKNNILQTM